MVGLSVEHAFFAESVQGASHIKKEIAEENKETGRKFPCQDKSFSAPFPESDFHRTNFSLTAVCDGHGGAAYFRSEKGASFAIDCMKKILPQHIDSIAGNLCEDSIRAIIPPFLAAWKDAVDLDLEKNPITETEYRFLEADDKAAAERYRAGKDLHAIYGATFLAFVKANNFWFALQIGDGDIAVEVPDPESENKWTVVLPVPEDERNFLNQTTSLCDTNAEHEFRVVFKNQKSRAALCSTDGLANSFAGDNQLFSFYKKVLRLFRNYDFADAENGEADDKDYVNIAKKRASLAVNEIRTSLPDISKRGSGDDITLAGFVDIDTDSLKKHSEAKDHLEKARIFLKIPGKPLAEYYYRKAAEYGNSEAKYELGIMLLKEKSFDEAKKWLSEAMNDGIHNAKEPLAELLLNAAQAEQKEGKHAEAFEDFLKAAEYGIKEAQFAVSLYYGRPQDYENCGVRQNFAKAIEWTFAAAKQGHADAECKLGKCFKDGRGVQQNAEQSLEWYKKAADHGSAEAKEYLDSKGEK